MSRVGKLPVVIPAGVKVKVENNFVEVEGPSGKLAQQFPQDIISIQLDGTQIIVKPSSLEKQSRAMWGTARNIINNMVTGVKTAFKVEIMLNGVGFKASVDSSNVITLTLGYSHHIKYMVDPRVKVVCSAPTMIELSSCNKELLGQIRAVICGFRRYDPYKGKGVYIKGSKLRRKVGKKK